ncbi:hypothetical protein K438DRAFT_1813725 [Mycena galopus ATCC 62051]|nr:hypothetical protein K438DRAFT_1813725 [Mycena galopus ATCC 62051]
MYPYKLALLVLGATTAYAYPIAPQNSDSLALVKPVQDLSRAIQDPRTVRVKGDEKRQIHNADYGANGPPPSPNSGPAQDVSSPSPANPTPSEPIPKSKRSDTALGDFSYSRLLERADARQIHNADYQASPSPAPEASSPPPANPAPTEPGSKDRRFYSEVWRGTGISSPSRSLEKRDNEVDMEKSVVARSIPYMHSDDKRQIHNADYQASPTPAEESSSPANPPAAAPSSSAAQDKRTESSFEIIPSTSRADDSSVSIKKRSMGDTFGANLLHHRASKLVSRIAGGDRYGLRRRNVEELTNIHNRNFDHDAVIHWSRTEVDKMLAWSKLPGASMES